MCSSSCLGVDVEVSDDDSIMGRDGEGPTGVDVYGTFHAREVEPIICHTVIFTTVCTFYQWSKLGNSKTEMDKKHRNISIFSV